MKTHQWFFRILLLSITVLVATSFAQLPLASAQQAAKLRQGTLKRVLEKGTLRVGVSLFTPWTLKT